MEQAIRLARQGISSAPHRADGFGVLTQGSAALHPGAKFFDRFPAVALPAPPLRAERVPVFCFRLFRLSNVLNPPALHQSPITSHQSPSPSPIYALQMHFLPSSVH